MEDIKHEVVQPQELTLEDKQDRLYLKEEKHIRMDMAEAHVHNKHLTDAYIALGNIRFNRLGDSAYRDKIVRAQQEIELAFTDFLVDDAYWRKRYKKHRNQGPEEYWNKVQDDKLQYADQSK